LQNHPKRTTLFTPLQLGEGEMFSEGSPAGALLLVVDDDDAVRTSLAHSMEARGYRVIERPCGQTALDYLREGELPELILLDLVMPNMDGWEFRVAQLGNPLLAGIPVVALSGDPSPKARAFHADAFLAKPLTLPALVEAVDEVLGRAATATGLHTKLTQELAFLGEVLEDKVPPMRLASLIVDANVQAALSHLSADSGPRVDEAQRCLRRARVAGRIVDTLLTRAELFAHRNFSQPRSARPRVLVIDDDAPSRDLLVEALQEAFTVSAAENAVDALHTLSVLDDYDVVVCRLWMPLMTGADLLRVLRATHPEQARRFLFMASASERDQAEERKLEDCDHLGVLCSPVLVDDICGIIEDSQRLTH
jgi:CheY-like chemotaxis protein